MPSVYLVPEIGSTIQTIDGPCKPVGQTSSSPVEANGIRGCLTPLKGEPLLRELVGAALNFESEIYQL